MTPRTRRRSAAARRSRAIIMAVLLAAFVVLVYAITIAKMGLAGMTRERTRTALLAGAAGLLG